MIDQERKRRLKLNISATNMPSIHFHEDDLSFSFTDWDENEVRIDFQSTLAFRWFNNMEKCEAIEDDVAFEILRSNWITELKESIPKGAQSDRRLRHYRFCVYNCWVLEVACESLKT